VVGHIVTVHESLGVFSRDFQHKLRRSNYVTPKNYLDFINTYLRLLDEHDKAILNQVRSRHDCVAQSMLVPIIHISHGSVATYRAR